MKQKTSCVWRVVATLALMPLMCIPVLAAGELPKDVQDLFSRGYQAIERQEWGKAEKLIREASGQWFECGKNIRLDGMFTRPFLPHYLLGVALYEQGKCSEALAEWEESEADGCVQKSKQDYRTLQRLRVECEEEQ